ncbi:MAG: histidine kinase [Cyanobacteria bacterium RM1_2_2]|nr:histidine kinase [Cyanobacteria bacterium RM1_2_2]
MAGQTEEQKTSPQIEEIKTELRKVQQEGQLRSERIREIVRTAIAQSATELKQGSGEIRSIVKGTLSAVIESLQDRGKSVQEDVTASIEGIVEGVSQARREAISKSQNELTQLQNQIQDQENQMNAEIEETLTEINETGSGSSADVRDAIRNAITTLQDSEEATLLRKRYAQLQAQLAILKANLAARYGEQYEDLKHHLEDAKVWYDSSRQNATTAESTPLEQKQSDFEQKMGEAGAAIARKEKQAKQILKELLNAVMDLTRDDKQPR